MKSKSIVFSLAFAFIMVLTPRLAADTWTVDPEKSKLAFEVRQGSVNLTGEFTSWEVGIDFDMSSLEDAKMTAQIKTASASTGNLQIDSTLPAAEWFDVSDFPTALFEADGAVLIESNIYRVDGMLTIKGVSHPIRLDFELDVDGDTAKVHGTAKLNRLDYKLGEGVGTDTLGDTINVELDLTATR